MADLILLFYQLFMALGNDRPPILIRLEDEVLQAIVGISKGKPRRDVINALYSGIKTLEMALATDERSLGWFDFPESPSEVPSTPLAGKQHSLNLTRCLKTIQRHPKF
jgi:hypothetical protein